MKKLVVFSILELAIGTGLLLFMNTISFIPFSNYGNDPHSNLIIVSVLFFAVTAVLFGVRNSANNSSGFFNASYSSKEIENENKSFDINFPFAIVSGFYGVIFIIIYFIMNK